MWLGDEAGPASGAVLVATERREGGKTHHGDIAEGVGLDAAESGTVLHRRMLACARPLPAHRAPGRYPGHSGLIAATRAPVDAARCRAAVGPRPSASECGGTKGPRRHTLPGAAAAVGTIPIT